MPHPEETSASPVDAIIVFPGWLRWLSRLQSVLVPYIFYVFLTLNSTSSRTYLYESWALLWLCCILALALSRMDGKRWWGFGLGWGLSVVLSLAWVPSVDSPYVCYMVPIVAAVALYRIHRFARRNEHEENRKAFYFDLVLMPLGLVACAPFAGLHSAAFAWVAFNGMLALLLRLYTMWANERIVNATQQASLASWWWFAGLACLLVLFVVNVGDALLHSRLSLPWFGANSNYTTLLSTLSGDHSSRASLADKMRYAQVTMNHGAFTTSEIVITAVLVAAAVLGLVWLGMWLYRWIRREGGRRPEPQRADQAARRWIRHTEGLHLLPTEDPVRKTLQRWIHSQYRKGMRMQRHETADTFLEHTLPAGTPLDGQITKEQFVRMYNQVRYRGKSGQSE